MVRKGLLFNEKLTVKELESWGKEKKEKTREIRNLKNSPLRARVVAVAGGTRTWKATE